MKNKRMKQLKATVTSAINSAPSALSEPALEHKLFCHAVIFPYVFGFMPNVLQIYYDGIDGTKYATNKGLK